MCLGPFLPLWEHFWNPVYVQLNCTSDLTPRHIVLLKFFLFQYKCQLTKNADILKSIPSHAGILFMCDIIDPLQTNSTKKWLTTCIYICWLVSRFRQDVQPIVACFEFCFFCVFCFMSFILCLFWLLSFVLVLLDIQKIVLQSPPKYFQLSQAKYKRSI